ncbi:Os01g0620400 [Oryza sativa Japonica Group]|uniref:Os01g0620400 protein n=2 Tax=Oryza sativa subsp. japonica TaxID=39947 RepID=Q0JL65_ORYSJ|nr:hypothetical protein EE612_004121 [Oryza sativa]KAF2951218.1 hypothetical protein DAI22_01g245900 [Oryza sativa Japonica Group]BAF05513.1 Os01g0620400 [Oryza sativa Japonica Group]BAG88457.1 unnamed protein product [Oryza sativa Japonica Group]BAS73207.1 Os01g0620400 [Oryza sativa Japonica Group]|eukprot:NP_001043599.1 Os01g0620400 [Oryza sativa Japonica Group]
MKNRFFSSDSSDSAASVLFTFMAEHWKCSFHVTVSWIKYWKCFSSTRGGRTLLVYIAFKIIVTFRIFSYSLNHANNLITLAESGVD